ncbi:FAS1-like dehydratase domain-containing protein [Roseovarius autotrophicus]|uniref:FAS1-like dehydratase domain-containing protein n=1 Tax=Roseovarius autotrophicus TaxID=2824121 RepID=UPI001A1084D7|nr:MaoC family dehydratase N-terminal domain-containing protein [Roseovarius autotrophicus]MBE0453689.1 MaoC family dehydratase N-terminal domain-containing protein [Roseovarius sp.]
MTDYSDWTGRSFAREEPITDRLIDHFNVTLAGTLAEAPVPVGLHWCLAPDAVTPDLLGRDCHPRPGLFLPALPLPRRMWAGGALEFHGAFAPGDVVARETTVEDVTFKEGRSGRLGFVTVRHVYRVVGEMRLNERQDIVYREDPKPGEAVTPPSAEDWQGATGWQVTPDPVLLFRFSALTFNGHRIHYDHPYATEVEGYAGLVVHGPMQAVWMMNLAAHVAGHLPAHFTYRGLSPLICGAAVVIEARETEGGLDLRVRREVDGVATMTARAEMD